MKQKLESIINKGKMMALAGIMSLVPLTLSSQSLKSYVEPRVGAVIPVSAEKQTYNPSFLVGVDYGFNVEKIGVGLELGIDYFHSSAEYIKTNTLWQKLNLNFSPFELFLPNAKVKPYLSAGASLLTEFSAIDIPEFGVHDELSNSTFGLEFGVGATLFDRINLRAAYTFLPTSENVKGMITLMLGYRLYLDQK